jgi:maltose/moltooligosaccharide transporter
MRSVPRSLSATLKEIQAALREMPPTVRQLAVMMLFQWYAMFCHWEYLTLSLAHTMNGSIDAASFGFGEAVPIIGRIGGFYNFIALMPAIAMIPLAWRIGPRRLDAACLLLG